MKTTIAIILGVGLLATGIHLYGTPWLSIIKFSTLATGTILFSFGLAGAAMKYL